MSPKQTAEPRPATNGRPSGTVPIGAFPESESAITVGFSRDPALSLAIWCGIKATPSAYRYQKRFNERSREHREKIKRQNQTRR